MITAALLLCLAVQDAPDEDEGFDPFAWARALEKLDLSLSSGDFTMSLSGELELDGYFFGDDPPPGITVEEAALRAKKLNLARPAAASPSDGGKLRLFADYFYGNYVTGSVELRVDHGDPTEDPVAARLEQYWVRLRPPGIGGTSLRLGKFAPPVGNFIPRHSAQENPLTTFPLPYDHVTTFVNLGDTAAQLITRRDVADKKFWRVPVWQEVYSHGMGIDRVIGKVTVTLAATNSAPATWPWQWEVESGDLRNPTFYARVQADPTPAMKIGASFAQGPYEKPSGTGLVGEDPRDFDQRIIGVDFFYGRGDVEIHAEAMAVRFELPRADTLDLFTGYVEARLQLFEKLFGAARVGQMHFGTIRDAAGNDRHWDYAVTRAELGAGYAFEKNLILKASGQANFQHAGKDPDDNMLTVQLVLTF